MAGNPRSVSLSAIRRELVALLAGRGRVDLGDAALDRVAFTDDGSTIYVHVLPKPSWPHRRAGQAYVLAYAEKRDLCTLADWRALLGEAWLLLHDEADDLVRWFDGA
jgi:hypothetical protein